jgi:prolyl oligopeptidase
MYPLGSPPHTTIESVADVLHGVQIPDPYRWLEDQHSPRTRAWIEEQTRYARAYLDAIPGRQQIRKRVRELLDIETYDSFLKSGNRYFFRKRLPGQQQPCIYFREPSSGRDQLLIDPVERGTGPYTAVIPVRISADGSLLLYEVKQGGERAGTFEIVDVSTRRILGDSLPHGYLRGFAFAPDGRSFYYSHEATEPVRPFYRAAFQHVLGTGYVADQEIFRAGEDQKLRLVLIAGPRSLGFLVFRFAERTYTDFYVWRMGSASPPVPILRNADYSFVPRLLPGRIVAVIDERAPNRRIVDVQARKNHNPAYFDLVPETDAPIRDWALTSNHLVVSYACGITTQIRFFDRFGHHRSDVPSNGDDSLRIIAASLHDDELLLERESFTRPIEVVRCVLPACDLATWAARPVPFDPADYRHIEVTFSSKDSTSIPVFLVGRHDVLSEGAHPALMTSYGGFGVPMTPQFSVFAACLLERGCLLALPNIRGGSERGAFWHQAAKRRNRQTAFDDFTSCAEWLIAGGRTTASQLAIFGGSNSGLLVGAAMTQRPELFQAVLCMVPLLDMLRYHLFDNAHVWRTEFGTAEDPEDFDALLRYSPYHAVKDRVAYPATMLVSGDADQNCNPLHARKMAARLQAANISDTPILIDYRELRGHSPVLPLTTRIDALTDRLAFLCDQLHLSV